VSTRHYQISKRVPNEQLVRQVDQRRHKELLMVAATGLSLAAALLAYAWQHFEMIQYGYRMEELRLEREYLVKIHRQLALERAALASPDRIEAIAKRELGMTSPTESQIVVIEPDRWGPSREVSGEGSDENGDSRRGAKRPPSEDE
jgi:cell division protein FtsL